MKSMSQQLFQRGRAAEITGSAKPGCVYFHGSSLCQKERRKLCADIVEMRKFNHNGPVLKSYQIGFVIMKQKTRTTLEPLMG
uniref:Uncharacterized protein n=1 Tax=Romanomermis culicivorax TaxID=13658 RepID=A0A915JHH8_ROMCU